jgi:chemotaxis protein histidine kinase CheA
MAEDEAKKDQQEKDKTQDSGQTDEKNSEVKEEEKSEEKVEESKKPEAEKKDETAEKEKEEPEKSEEKPIPEEKSDEKKEEGSEEKKEEKPEEKPKQEAPEKKKDERKFDHTRKETDELVEEIHEVAEGLKEIVEDVPEEKVKPDNKSKPEEKPKDKQDSEKKDEDKKEEEPKKEDEEKVDKEEEKKEETAENEDKKSEDQAKENKQEKKKINPFGFLKKTKKEEEKKEEGKDKEGKKEDKAKKKLPKALKIALIVIGALLLIVLILAGLGFILSKPVISNGKKAATLGNETYQLLKTQDLTGAQAKLAETKQALQATQNSYKKIGFLKIIPMASKYYKDGQAGIEAAMVGMEAGEILLEAIAPYADVLGFSGEGSFEGGTAEDRIVMIVETLDKVSPQLDSVGEKMVQVDELMSEIDPNDYPENFRGTEIRSKIIKAEALVEELTKALTDAKPLVDVLPSILGHPEGKKYLVLFQNDGELRPTGGFMSAFAVLRLDKGRVSSEKSDDIYSLDNKFTKVLESPDAIATHLNEKKWHLRNMNFSPDFKISMDTFKENYDTLHGEYEVDGIIAIDTEVLARIVEITGPLEVDGWGTFTIENDERCNLPQIICELEHIIDRPLATLKTNRKATILGPMMKALLEKSFKGGKDQLSQLIPLIFELMEEKHLLVYFGDESNQAAAEAFNIAGRIMDYDGDYLHINDANLGGAKSNFYIDQKVEQEIEIQDDGTILKKVYITYKHNEDMDNCNLEAGQLCLSGIQRDYFRVYVPQGSELVEGLGSMVEIQTGEEFDKTFFDGFFELRPMSQAKIALTYKLPFKAGEEYKMLIQKQPGTKNSQYTININGQQDEFVLEKDIEKTYKLN